MEEDALSLIDDAITYRIELVLAQKMRLGKYFNLISDAEETRLFLQVDTEVGFMLQWLNKDATDYDEIRQRYVDVLKLDFTDT